jgi:hypothetical protein
LQTAAAALSALEDPEALQLRWNGETEQTISVFKGREMKRVSFKDIIMIKYNRTESKLLFQFSSENSSKPEELLLTLLPVPDAVWQGLQTRCYSLTKGKPSRQRCDVEGPDFFEEKTKSLMNLRIKRTPISPSLNRPLPQVAHRGANNRQKPRKSSRPMFQTRLNAIPSLQAPNTPQKNAPIPAQKSSPDMVANPINQPRTPRRSSPKSVATPQNQKNSQSLERDHDSNQSYLNVEGDGTAHISGVIVKDSHDEGEENSVSDIEPESEYDFEVESDDKGAAEIESKDEDAAEVEPEDEDAAKVEPEDKNAAEIELEGEGASEAESENKDAAEVEPEDEDAAEAGLYYRSSLRSGVPARVRLNDLVVRLRSDKERENGGKRDKLDLFDGPWRIVEFDLPQKTYSMRIPITSGKRDR